MEQVWAKHITSIISPRRYIYSNNLDVLQGTLSKKAVYLQRIFQASTAQGYSHEYSVNVLKKVLALLFESAVKFEQIVVQLLPKRSNIHMYVHVCMCLFVSVHECVHL